MSQSLSQHELPDFGRPPVVEVALAVQFEPLDIRAVHFGSIWDEFRDSYPTVDEHPRRPPMTIDGGTQITFDLRSGLEKPNLHFVSDGGDRLVQFQNDRLVVNWRRRADEDYPRYENAVRPMFVDAWERLTSALNRLSLGALRPNVCEVVYVNTIDAGSTWQGPGEEQAVLAPWTGAYSDSFLPPAAEVRVSAKYPLANDAGWLNIESNPVRRTDTGAPALILQLSSRGAAKSPDLDGALNFLDLGREWIVKGFVSFTDTAMHQEWGMHE